MTNSIVILEYETKDKNEVIKLIGLNTPDYFAVEEEQDLVKYLDTERELYYVLLIDGIIVGFGNIVECRCLNKFSYYKNVVC